MEKISNTLETLFLIFLVLKLTGAIAWSWWWVTAPLWMPILVALLVCTVVWLVVDESAKEKKE